MNKYNPRFDRGGYGKYNKNKNFISMEAGTDAFYLEDEANESQWIQNELRADIIRKHYYSGIFQKEDNDIILSSEIFNENTNIRNAFFIKPMIANINGYFINVHGSNGHGILPQSDLNYIKLPEPPEEGEYYDFIYLEMCFAEIKFNNDIWYDGNYNNSHGTVINDLFDRRLHGESNRRIQLKWSIHTARIPVNYDKLFDESINAVYVPAYGAYHKQSKLGFWNAPTALDNKTISDDIGLWIAGTGLQEKELPLLYTTDGYSYAIPLFKIKRRNTQGYYSANLFGGDLLTNNTNRPDGKFADIIYQDDIIDLRNLIRIDNISKILHNNFENLLLNNSNRETKLYSTYFGVDPIITDGDTLLYEGCNKKDFNTNLLQGSKEYEFTLGVEQEGIILKNNTYLSQSFNIKNVNHRGLTIQFFIKTEYNELIGLLTVKDSINNILLKASINDGILKVNNIQYDFKQYFNKFVHIAIAFKNTLIELIINNKIVAYIDNDINLTDQFVVEIGKADNIYANCIFDEIEISNVYENQFNRIPKALGNNNADITIDTQLGRKNYTLINNIDTYTFHERYTTDIYGTINFDLELPSNLSFTDVHPNVYFDNESDNIAANITWQKENNIWHCNIIGLGNNIPYNLVIIANIQFPDNQGLNHLPKKAHIALAEKAIDKTFFAVMDSVEYQLHNINYINNAAFNSKDKIFAINQYTCPYGFCAGIKYYLHVNGNSLTLNNNIYTYILGIFSIIYNGKNILKNYYKQDNKFIIILTENVDAELEFNLIINEYCCLYSLTKSGILNLYKIEEINEKGNGTRKEFIYRSNSKIISSLQSKFDQQIYHYAYVNNIPTKVHINITGTFIHYTFDIAPANKADICMYIVSEYDVLRSERLEFIYEIDNYKSENIYDYDNNNIIYYENEIFVTTNGYGVYPHQKDILPTQELALKDVSTSAYDTMELNENEIYSLENNEEYTAYMLNKTMPTLDYLPMTELLKFKLTPVDILSSNQCKIIFDKDNYAHILVKDALPISTNLSAYINYCIPNSNGSFLKTCNKLYTKFAKKTVQGYTNCSIDNKSFYSLTTLDKDSTHINVFPFIIKDNNTKLLKMGILTQLKNDNQICIEANNSAIIIYSLSENYLLRHI